MGIPGRRRRRSNLDDVFESIYENPSCLANYSERDKRDTLRIRNFECLTLLQYAVKEKQFEKMCRLLDAGCDPNDYTLSSGMTPLHMAIATSQARAVKTLLEHNADYEKLAKCQSFLNPDGDNSISPLMLAVICAARDNTLKEGTLAQRMQIVHLLLEAGSDVNRHVFDTSALRHAVEKEHLQLVKLLLQYGGNANLQNGDMYPPLLNGMLKNNLELCKILIDNGATINNLVLVDPQIGKHNELSLLAVAVSLGYSEQVKLLLHCGANPDLLPIENNCRRCAGVLCRAVTGDRLPILNLLLRYNPRLNWETGAHGALQKHTSPLEECIKVNFLEGAQLLVYAGCVIESTPLQQYSNTKDNPVLVWLKAEAREPVNLMMQSIYLLRRQFGLHLNHKVQQLPLSTYLQSLVLLTNLLGSK